MKTKPSILGTVAALVAAPTLALAGDRDAFPRHEVILKAKEAVRISEDLTYEFETFLRNRYHCPPSSRDRALLDGLKELERRAGHVIKAAVTGCMPTTIERRSNYLRTTVERTMVLAKRVHEQPCDIPGELELIDELACEISALTRERIHPTRDHRGGHDFDFDRHERDRHRGFDRHDRFAPVVEEPVRRHHSAAHREVAFSTNLHFHNGRRALEFRIYR
ncbi:MAG: hypothetical protein AAGJ79_04525 [Verrucomicrobiota bacterium]